MSEQIIETNGLVKSNVIERLTKKSTKQTIENHYLAKSRIIANNWLNKHKNDFEYFQHQTRSGTGESFGSVARGLEPAKSLESIKKT